MNILLGVSGSISAYKSYDLARLFIKAGHQVKVILTKGALEFIKPNTFIYLGCHEVYSPDDDFNISKQIGSVTHIELKKWTDQFIVAPLSANTLAKLATGQCDDLLSTVFLSLTDETKILFPAMNTNMYLNPIVQRNFKALEIIENLYIYPAATGELACGDSGIGKLPNIETIFDFCESYNPQKNHKKILITAGATIAPLDSVRYVTNPASGKSAFEMAKVYLSRGYQVQIISGFYNKEIFQNLLGHPDFELFTCHTTLEMKEIVERLFSSTDIYISTAAISDFQFNSQQEKIKKTDSSEMSLKYDWAPDILASVLKSKTNQKIVGFAAETNKDTNVFLNKWKRKPVDLLVGNHVSNGVYSEQKGFGSSRNQYYFVKDGIVSNQLECSKQELANYILRELNE